MTRLVDESTPDYLARSIDEVIAEFPMASVRHALIDLAERARKGHFDDFACPEEVDVAMPQGRLVTELRAIARRAPHYCKLRLESLAGRVVDGDFDATRAEGDAWARSPEGREALGAFDRELRS